MNFKSIFEKAKAAQQELKGKYGDEISEARFVVQFQNLQAYQYKTDVAGIGKLRKVDFADVIMVQLVVGQSVKGYDGRNKFRLRAVKLLDIKEDYEKKVKNQDAGHEFTW